MTDIFDQNFWLMILQAAGHSLGRLLITYLICVVLGFIIAVWLTASSRMERFAIPVFDLIQNIPPLAFYPLVAFVFIGLNFIEGAAIFVLLAGMLWPLLFALAGVVHSIPQDIRDAAVIFGAERFRYVRHVLLPAMFPAFVSASMSSWSLGWNLLVVAEWIRYKQSHIQLPGLGGLLGRSASGAEIDFPLFVAVITFILLFVFIIHFLVWRPLLKRAEKYKFD